MNIIIIALLIYFAFNIGYMVGKKSTEKKWAKIVLHREKKWVAALRYSRSKHKDVSDMVWFDVTDFVRNNDNETNSLK